MTDTKCQEPPDLDAAGNHWRQKKMLPSEVPHEQLTAPLIDDATSLKVGRGLLDDDEIHRHMDEAMALIKRAAIRGYAGNLGKAVEDLREAMRLWIFWQKLSGSAAFHVAS